MRWRRWFYVKSNPFTGTAHSLRLSHKSNFPNARGARHIAPVAVSLGGSTRFTFVSPQLGIPTRRDFCSVAFVSPLDRSEGIK